MLKGWLSFIINESLEIALFKSVQSKIYFYHKQHFKQTLTQHPIKSCHFFKNIYFPKSSVNKKEYEVCTLFRIGKNFPVSTCSGIPRKYVSHFFPPRRKNLFFVNFKKSRNPEISCFLGKGFFYFSPVYEKGDFVMSFFLLWTCWRVCTK